MTAGVLVYGAGGPLTRCATSLMVRTSSPGVLLPIPARVRFARFSLAVRP
jgi:hypothetical protein